MATQYSSSLKIFPQICSYSGSEWMSSWFDNWVANIRMRKWWVSEWGEVFEWMNAHFLLWDKVTRENQPGRWGDICSQTFHCTFIWLTAVLASRKQMNEEVLISHGQVTSQGSRLALVYPANNEWYLPLKIDHIVRMNEWWLLCKNMNVWIKILTPRSFVEAIIFLIDSVYYPCTLLI